MGLFVRQDEQNAQISSKVSADLAERLNKRALSETDKTPPVILDNQQKTRGGGIFWFVIIGGVAIAVIALLLTLTNGSIDNL